MARPATGAVASIRQLCTCSPRRSGRVGPERTFSRSDLPCGWDYRSVYVVNAPRIRGVTAGLKLNQQFPGSWHRRYAQSSGDKNEFTDL